MKKLLLLISAVFLLTGCAAPTFETINDADDLPAMATPATVLVDLPEDAAAPAMDGASGKLYFCGDYEIMVEVMPSGNLDKTLQTLTGFGREELEIIKTERCGVSCYESAWSAAGEAGDHVGRVLVMDDNSYHYCVSVMASAENASDCLAAWNKIMDSVALTES